MSRWLKAGIAEDYYYTNHFLMDTLGTWFFKNTTKSEILDDCKFIVEENNLKESLLDNIQIKETDKGCIVRFPKNSSLLKYLRNMGYTAAPYGDIDSTNMEQRNQEMDSNIYWMAKKLK